jgi:ribose transport system substrate-binding protein
MARVGVLACVLWSGAGCGNQRAGGGSGAGAATASGSDTGKVIGVSLLTHEQEFYQEVEAGIRAAAARHGYRLIVTSGDFDLAKQQNQIDNFIVQHVDGIIVSPVNSEGVGPAINRAMAAHIPVVTADTKAVGTPVVAHVASKNQEGGQLAGAFMAQALGDSGTVAVIGQQETHTGLERQEAFLAEIAKHPRMAVVAIVNGGGLRDKALKVAEDVLQGHPDLRGIFTINDEMALGALAAARARGKTAANFTIVGYDASPEAVAAIRAHSPLKADVAQAPKDIGAYAVDAMARYLEHQPVDSVIIVPVRIVDSQTP